MLPLPAAVQLAAPVATQVQLALRGGRNVESWLAGCHITQDEGQYRLKPGFYPWLVAVTLHQVPPIPGVCIKPRLVQTPDYAQAMELWRAEVRNLRPDLVRIAAEEPGSAAAEAAKRLLKQIDAD